MREVLGATPEPWQVEALNLAAKHDRVSIRAGHGVGKTTCIAWIVLWFALTRTPFKILLTANSQDQLRDVVWSEIRKWAQHLPTELRDKLQINAEHIIRTSDPESFVAARTASSDNPEALQGFHDENMLVLVEEASGVPDIVFELARGTLSTPRSKMLMFGNPTRTTGFFFDSHHKLRDRWQTMRVSSLDVERAQGHIKEIADQYGKDSNIYRVRVLGEFPDTESNAVISLQLCEAAKNRDVKALPMLRPVWGVDVARFGSDRTALAKRQGNVQLEPVISWRGKDTMQTAGLIAAEYHKVHQIAPDERPAEILVDVIGIGAGVVDRLRELNLPGQVIIRGINVAESAAVSERFMRLRDELWWKARDWLDAKDCRLADDDALIAELTAPKYDMTSTGKIVVESKDDMKKRGVLGENTSPDLADSWCLTFAGGLTVRDEHEIDAYRRKRKTSRGTFMGA